MLIEQPAGRRTDSGDRLSRDETCKGEGEFVASRGVGTGRRILECLSCLLLPILSLALLGLSGFVNRNTGNTTAFANNSLPYVDGPNTVPRDDRQAIADTVITWPCSPPSSTLSTIPVRLAIYYGWPSLVNGCAGDVECATDAFAGFDLIVLGDGLEHPTHGDHDKTREIISNLTESKGRDVDIYGYIDLGVTTQNLPTDTIKHYVDEWDEMCVAGIFLDDAGQDFGVDRPRLCEVVEYVHGKGVKVFVNAWEPDDVFADDPPGVPTCLREGDWYLAESHPVSSGQCGDLDPWWEKVHKAHLLPSPNWCQHRYCEHW